MVEYIHLKTRLLSVGLLMITIIASGYLLLHLVGREKPIHAVEDMLEIQHKATPIQASGPLTVYPDNPRYFSDGNGNVVYLAGSHTWSNFQDTGATNPPVAFDYTVYLDFLVANNLNFFRLWTWEQERWGPWLKEDIYFSPMMYEQVKLTANDKPKFDLTRFNDLYFDRLRQRVAQAGERGMYVSIMLFDGWSIEDKNLGDGNPWLSHPFHRDNNVNGIDGDLNHDGQGLEIHSLQAPAITALQKAYVQRVIDTVNDLDNVLFEISNESHKDSYEWQYDLINFIKQYEAGKPKQHPVGMSVEWPGGDNAVLFHSPADWVAPNSDGGYKGDPPAADGKKVIVADTDHLWGIGGNYQWAWKSFLRGHNLLFMDPYDCSPVWPPSDCDPDNVEWRALRTNLGYTRSYANRMNLAAMSPRNDLASSGYCLANPATNDAEYLVYLPAGSTVTAILQSLIVTNYSPSLYLPSDSTVTVDLSATASNLYTEWFNPNTGVVIEGDTTVGGALRSFTAPFRGDAILYIYQTPRL